MSFNIFWWIFKNSEIDSDEFVNWVLWHGAGLKKGDAETFDELDDERFVAIHDKFVSAICETQSYFDALYLMFDEDSAKFALDYYIRYGELLALAYNEETTGDDDAI